MQITLFKGLLPVNLPDAWFSHPERIKLGRLQGRKQAIDFRANGGAALAFWIDSDRDTGTVHQRFEELPDHIVPDADWSAGPWAVESRRVVALFGQSGTPLDLTSLA